MVLKKNGLEGRIAAAAAIAFPSLCLVLWSALHL